MKKKWKALLITASYVILIITILIQAINLKSYDRLQKFDTNKIAGISIVNNKTGQGKGILRRQDVISICQFFNTTKMHRIKNWDGYFKRIGGATYTFIFTTKSAQSTLIGYYDGSYLVNNGVAYSIETTGFEDFWKMKYKEKKYTYAGFY